MKLASHNTMSYLKPKKWWMRPFHFIAKCQSKTIYEQYKLGIRMFDLRITYDKHNLPVFAHGSMIFKNSDVINILSQINKWGDCYVRLVLEINKTCKNIDTFTKFFNIDTEHWRQSYKNINFFEGTRKYDWFIVNKELHKNNPLYIQKVSSMTGTILDDWWPRLYAMFNNKRNIDKHKNDDVWMFIDFVGKYQ